MTIRARDELTALEAAGRVVAKALAAMKAALRPGVTTGELDAIAAGVFAAEGARSAPRLVYAFPGATCISVNDEVVHGIPGSRVIEPGDVVKLDVTAEKDGFMADAAVTVPVAPASPTAARLAACVRSAFARAFRVARAGVPIRRIGREVENEAKRFGFAVVPELSGHGIGRTIHEAPSVPNFDDPFANRRLEEGTVIAVEPIVAAGSGGSYLARDGWTVRTADRALAAHHEHTIVVTRGRPIVLTRS